MRLLLRQFLGQYNASQRPDDSKFQHGTCVLGGLCGCPPSSGANWQYQASHDLGACVGVCQAVALIGNTRQVMMKEKWSGWNRTNQTSGYGPVYESYTKVLHSVSFQKYNTTLERHIIGLVSQSVDQYGCDQWNPNLYLLIAAILHFACCLTWLQLGSFHFKGIYVVF